MRNGKSFESSFDCATFMIFWNHRFYILGAIVLFALIGSYKFYSQNYLSPDLVFKFTFELKGREMDSIRSTISRRSFSHEILERISFKQKILEEHAGNVDLAVGAIQEAIILDDLHNWNSGRYGIGVKWKDVNQAKEILTKISDILSDNYRNDEFFGLDKDEVLESIDDYAYIKIPSFFESGVDSEIFIEHVLKAPYIKEGLMRHVLQYENRNYNFSVITHNDLGFGRILIPIASLSNTQNMLAVYTRMRGVSKSILLRFVELYNDWDSEFRQQYIDTISIRYGVSKYSVNDSIYRLVDDAPFYQRIVNLSGADFATVKEGISFRSHSDGIFYIDVSTGDLGVNAEVADAIQSVVQQHYEYIGITKYGVIKQALGNGEQLVLTENMIGLYEKPVKYPLSYKAVDAPYLERAIGGRYGLTTLVVGYGILGLILSMAVLSLYASYKRES